MSRSEEKISSLGGSGLPILVLCTARLELLERRAEWAGGKRNATTITLAPLSDDETEELLRSLLGRAPSASTIKRAGGNPLFAHELARIAGRASEDELALPDSLRAVISARLDALPPELKTLAADAAVVGEVFWSGALASLTGLDKAEVEERLDRLVANDVARRVRASSLRNETEYIFLHVLVRDVAYGQLPRRDRVRLHRAAAEWIGQLADDRLTDHAEFVAHHYVEALELARVLDWDDESKELEPLARRFLALAGDRAYGLDAAQAESYYRRALDLTSPDDPARGRLLAKLGDLAQYTGQLSEAERLSRAAIQKFQAHDDLLGAGEAMVTLAVCLWRLGRPERERRELLAEAVRTLEQRPPGEGLARAYARLGTHYFLAGRSAECIEWSRKALVLADELGLAALKSRPLQFHGHARLELGDLSGLEDMREALRLGRELGLAFETATAASNLGESVCVIDGPAAGLELKRTSVEFSEQRGLLYLAKFTGADMLWLLFDAGEWDKLLERADDALAWDHEHGPSQLPVAALPMKARALLWRGATSEAKALEPEYLPRAREVGDPQVLVPALASGAAARHAVGDDTGGIALIEELDESTRSVPAWWRARELPTIARICAGAGAVASALTFFPSKSDPVFARGRHCVASAEAILAEASGELERAEQLYASAAEGWRGFGCPPELAYARLGEGRCLCRVGRGREAGVPLLEAREIFAKLRARPFLAETEGWLEQSAARLS